MDVFADVDMSIKQKIVDIWKKMNEDEKNHFINQVALALSVWGSDDVGRGMVVETLKLMMTDGSKNLVDFGIYINNMINKKEVNFQSRIEKAKRAALVLEGYRIKNALPSEPHKEYKF